MVVAFGIYNLLLQKYVIVPKQESCKNNTFQGRIKIKCVIFKFFLQKLFIKHEGK